MGKYYAVAKGKSNIPKIYDNWEQCKLEVIGAKGAIYKSFTKEEEAIEFIKNYLGSTSSHNEIFIKEDKEEEKVQEDYLHIYVDGSFKEDKENYSYGLVAVHNEEVIYKESGVGEEKEAISMRNVAGEVLGAMKAVDYALKHDYKKIKIFFDYQGIESWALGMWKRNNFLTQRYHEYMHETMKQIEIKFVKVKGHSGVKYNELADELASSALNW